MIDRYTREQFEAALPRASAANPLWQGAGMVNGEHCYVVPVKPGVLIFIRSSVRADDLAADAAKDSIRCWLASDAKGTPLSGKAQRWITRVNGWDARLLETLRALWRLGRQLEACPRCNVITHALRVRKDSANKGRWFAGCPNCRQFIKWLEAEPQQKESK